MFKMLIMAHSRPFGEGADHSIKNPGKPGAEIRAYPVWVLLLRANMFSPSLGESCTKR